MVSNPRRTERRTDALSQERIVEAAIELLDAQGEPALTFRSLAAHLATGSGAIYWHVANKNDLLSGAADAVICQALAGIGSGRATPQETIRAIALAVFDALDAHPWVGTQLAREPWQTAMLRIFDGVGTQLQRLGMPEVAQFNAASAVVSSILGLAAQYAAVMRLTAREKDRPAFLEAIASQWAERDPAQFPFVTRSPADCPTTTTGSSFLPVSVSCWLASKQPVRR